MVDRMIIRSHRRPDGSAKQIQNESSALSLFIPFIL